MMKIIKLGRDPSETPVHGRCNNCGTEVEFELGEGTITNDQRDGDFVTVQCPVCQRKIHSAVPPRHSKDT